MVLMGELENGEKTYPLLPMGMNTPISISFFMSKNAQCKTGFVSLSNTTEF